jgi:transcriptional regulator with XRE-family HTH domain
MFRNDLIREAMGKESLFKVAARAGVSTDTVARAREGENLSVKSLSAIAKALRLDMPALFTFDRNHAIQDESAQNSLLSVSN